MATMVIDFDAPDLALRAETATQAELDEVEDRTPGAATPPAATPAAH